jgi:hypothetical protein
MTLAGGPHLSARGKRRRERRVGHAVEVGRGKVGPRAEREEGRKEGRKGRRPLGSGHAGERKGRLEPGRKGEMGEEKKEEWVGPN